MYGGDPPRPSCSHNEIFYESYTNHGNHASGGGIINVHQTTNYQFSLSNPQEERENHRAALDSGDPPRRVSEQVFDYSTHLNQPKRRLTNPESSEDASRSKRQRIGNTMQIALDIAKQSADFCNPLKNALAGVSAVVAQYEEFEGVKDMIEGLLPQLNSLKQNITTEIVNEDPEETRRYAVLINAFGDIEKRSQDLLEKGMTTQFSDKEGDSTEVSRLVEQFREAIVRYQVSQYQAIYSQITDLISSFNTHLKLQEKSPAVKNKLDSVMTRLDQLCSKEDSDDEDRCGRWGKLFNTLRVIVDDGHKVYNRINAQGDNGSEDHIQVVSGIAEDIRDALLNYQTTRQQAIYDQHCELIDAGLILSPFPLDQTHVDHIVDLAVLNNCRRARGAAYQHGGRRGCLRGTREAVLNEIESWTKDFKKSPVFWLNGLAGTGKSTIAQTISEGAFADGLLGASFFCSRDFEDRSHLHFIFPTLAIQLAQKFPDFLAPVVSLLRSNPDVVYESLYNQMEKLIVEPLRLAEISTVIVIDALDECKDDEPSSAMLSVLGRFVERIPRVKFFITGRPEPRIRSGFRLPLLVDATKIYVLHDVHPDLINSDILLFLKHELSELSRRHRLEGWPSDEHIGLLCQRAAGLFIYAVATIKFLDSRTHLPERRLDVIVNLPECTVPEGKTKFRPRTTLDSLYMSVLQMAFSEEDTELAKVRTIIGAVVLVVNPLPSSGIAELTNLDPREVMLLLNSVQSLLILDEDSTRPVKSFHKSFPDFITDPSRCSDPRFYIAPEKLHFELAINCLALCNGLEQNLLNLPDYALNAEIEDLQARVEGRISVALQYACQSWHNHVTACREDTADVVLHLRLFLEKKFLAWLEVLSVLKATRAAVIAMEKLMVWLQEATQVSSDDQLIEMARDGFYFVTMFFETINVSATHIRHSALELTPLSSLIRKSYYHQRPPFPRVEIGIQDSRESSNAILSNDSESFTWSPCSQFVAVRGKDKVVKIRDALTFELVSALQPTIRVLSPILAPSYSPDGHFLACIGPFAIIIWDIQTGGVAKEIQCHNLNEKPLVWSSDRGLVGVLSDGTVDIYDVASGSRAQSSDELKSADVPFLWAYKKYFRVMTIAKEGETKAIDIFEVGPTLTRIESFSIQEGKYFIQSFSPTTYHISCFEKRARLLFILDIRNSRRLLLEKGSFNDSHTFSPDGRLFAASGNLIIQVWTRNYEDGCYIPWRRFPLLSSTLAVASDIQISPTSSVILIHCGMALRTWRLDSPRFDPPIHRSHLEIFSRSGTHIANADHQGETVTINLLAQTISQFIDTGIDCIKGLGLIGNILLVKGSSVVGAWLLTEEGGVSNVLGNRRAGPGDSIWTIRVSPYYYSRPQFSVEGEIGALKYGKTLHLYNSRTGEVFDSAQELPRFNGSGCWYSFADNLQAQDYHCNGTMQNAPPKYEWKLSDTTWDWKDGWLKDHQGKCLLWLPSEWRKDWRRNRVEWFPDISMLKFWSRANNLIMIKLH